MASVALRLRKRGLYDPWVHWWSLGCARVKSSEASCESDSAKNATDFKACAVLASRTKAHAHELLRQQIGLTQSSAHVRNGRLTWESLCSSRLNPFEARSNSAAWGVQGALWRAYRYVRGHAGNQFAALFLPVGYPDTVKDNYLRYSVMAATSNLLISVNMTLAATFLLYAVGLGAGAIPVAGALSWVLKDGAGQAGTLILGRIVAHDFDLNTRFWNLMSNLTVQLACCVEILTAFKPEWFLAMASLANILKGVSHIAGSSTRAAFNISFAQGENIADITAKSTSQYICTSLLGTCIGIFVSGLVGQNVSLALGVAAAVSASTTAISYAALRAVPLSNLNPTRMQLLLDHFVRTRMDPTMSETARRAPLPRPAELCGTDPVLIWPVPRGSVFAPPIHVNTPLPRVLASSDGDMRLLKVLAIHTHHDAKHLLLRSCGARRAALHVVLHARASPDDAVVAMMHAFLFRQRIKGHEQDSLPFAEEAIHLRATLREAQSQRSALLQGLRDSKWNLDRVCIESHVSRATW